MSRNATTEAVSNWLTNVAALGDPEGVVVTVVMDDGTELRKEFGDVELATQAPKEPEPATEGGDEQESDDAEGVMDEASLRDAWQEIVADDWNKFQSMAADHGVTEGDGASRIAALVEKGVTPEGSEVAVEDSEGNQPKRKFSELPKDEQDELRKEFEDDPEGRLEEVKDLLEDGEDYAAFGGECPAEDHDHSAKPIGRNFDENGFKPFCAGCLRKKAGFHLTTFGEAENDMFATLIEGGKSPEEAFEMAQ